MRPIYMYDKKEITMLIESTKSQNHDSLKMLIYGEPGNGKTFLVKSIQEPTLIISAEGGTLSISDAEIDMINIAKDNHGNLIPEEKRIARLGEVYAYLLTDECKAKYKWIYIDSLSEISQNLVKQLNLEFPDRKDSLVLYGENSKRMRSLVKSFRDIPFYNIVFTALASAEKDENNQRYLGISMIGKIGSELPAMFDEVLYLYKNDDERMLITSKSEKLIAKDRSGKLNKQEPANLQVVINKIRGV